MGSLRGFMRQDFHLVVRGSNVATGPARRVDRSAGGRLGVILAIDPVWSGGIEPGGLEHAEVPP